MQIETATLPTIAVAAGKGGTGKTLLATSLALAIHRGGLGPVELLDCDVEEPNAHILLRPEVEGEEPVHVPVPRVDLDTCIRCGKCASVCQNAAIAVIRQAVLTFPELCAGCGCCSYVCPVGAIEETPRTVGHLVLGQTEGLRFVGGRVNVGDQKATPVTGAVKDETSSDRITIIDAPPGTACPMQEAVDESDYCILITEPTPFGLSDLGAAVDTCRSIEVPCGVVINRAGSGFAGVEAYCEKEGVPLLLSIPQDRAIAEAYSRGEPLIAAQSKWQDVLVDLYRRVTA